MKKIALFALAATTAAIATPSMAQTAATGTVDVTGTVADKCFATTPITGTITLNELAQSNGTVAGTFPNAASGLSRQFTVKCTASQVTIKVKSDALNNSSDATTGSGYTGRVHYTSTLTASKASGGTSTAVYTTADSLPTETSTNLGDRLANTANNIVIAVSNGTTANPGDLLKAGTYSSTITLTVAPTVAP